MSILSYRDANFTSKLIDSLCSMFGIKKLRMTPYYAQCNGQVKHYHQMLMRMVGKV